MIRKLKDIRATAKPMPQHIEGTGYLHPASYSRAEDLTGMRVGDLVVLELAGVARQHRIWKVLCDCGKEAFVQGHRLLTHPPYRKTHCGCKSYITASVTNG